MGLTLEQLINLAKEVDATDSIDWGYLELNEDDVYGLMATHIMEMYLDFEDNPLAREIAASTILKLVVENFVINYQYQKLLEKTGEDNGAENPI